ncbi:ferritin [Candidatus Saganbacteria bacterium CG08_land_8_20_14_0_20_45_16]|uniref:Ferritin n=1 Tax=Candidatus Saganbacteria bacterium CG08_land_8_20_14_0_20_45_16 TaxID=2014293 RepID=A0A2H0XXV6_UNCSA|nr:MAG: ferritin [Candidatus Saganbacteria bacterium CG08_land_8_20_14_0_20_45_16]
MVKLWVCEICGDPYIGEAPPANCPFCGVDQKYIKEAKEAKVTFKVDLNEKDRANAEHALQVEISNAAFYFCAAEKTDDLEGKLLFKALGKVEAEHASVWKKILKLASIVKGNDPCHVSNQENLEDSHVRETRAIEFYKQAAKEAQNSRIKQIFEAFVEVEKDHLGLSKERLK